MRIDKKKKIITFTPSDGYGKYQIRLIDRKKEELINIKIYFSDDFMGLIVFDELEKDIDREQLELFKDTKYMGSANAISVGKIF